MLMRLPRGSEKALYSVLRMKRESLKGEGFTDTVDKSSPPRVVFSASVTLIIDLDWAHPGGL